MVFRGYLALALVGIFFILADLVQRTVVVALVRTRPARRQRVLVRWKKILAGGTLGIVRVAGGATLRRSPPLPGGPGVLVVMNHQSLLDIPLMVEAIAGDYPLFVTRRRYASGIPLVSHMLRLYEHPLVEPGKSGPEQLAALRERAATSRHPLVIFPEGTRTRDGNVGPFRRAGLASILSARSWRVHVVVADGMWRCARIHDFVHNIGSVRTRVACSGPLSYPDGERSVEEFIEELRSVMRSRMDELRDSTPAVSRG